MSPTRYSVVVFMWYHASFRIWGEPLLCVNNITLSRYLSSTQSQNLRLAQIYRYQHRAKLCKTTDSRYGSTGVRSTGARASEQRVTVPYSAQAVLYCRKNVGECRYGHQLYSKYGGSPEGGQRIGRNPEQQEQTNGKLTSNPRGGKQGEQTQSKLPKLNARESP